jgi:hypothetical protein
VKRVVVVAAGVAVLVAAWLILRPSADERSARDDAAAVSAAVAGYVVEHDRLPRLSVTTLVSSGGDTLWGADFLVETLHVPRADPAEARILFIVGEPEGWCVEALYTPAGSFLDASPSAWVAARGERGDVGRVVDGRCGDEYVLVLSAVSVDDVPEPGSIIDAVTAPTGTCLTSILDDGRSTGPLEVAVCGGEHFAEIYHSGEAAEADYGRFQDSAARLCAAAFPSFVGVPQNLSAFYAEAFTVSDVQWQAGARAFNCVLFLGADDYPLVGSARDSWR